MSDHDRRTADMATIRTLTLALVVLIGIAPMLGACHTAAGVGEDLSAGGQAISNSAKKLTP
jgi:predicted small secreted protein